MNKSLRGGYECENNCKSGKKNLKENKDLCCSKTDFHDTET